MELLPDQIKSIIDEIELPENLERKRLAVISDEIYDEKVYSYVYERIKKMYPKTFDLYTISDYSVEKKIVDKKAKAYKEQVIRKLDTPEDENQYKEITDNAGLTEAMAAFDRYKNQHKYALVGALPSLDQNGKPRWNIMALPPQLFDVIKDESGRVLAVILSYPNESYVIDSDSDGIDTVIAGRRVDEGANQVVYAIWTDKNHYAVKVYRSKETKSIIEILPIPNNEGNINPYGILPFVYAPYSDGPNYPNQSPLPNQTVELNALLSVYLTSGNMQVGTLVLKYPEDQTIKQATHGLMVAMSLPQKNDADAPETNAEYIAPTPNMSAHRESIMTYLAMVLDQQGINPAGALNSSPEKFASGLDRLLAEVDVQSIIEENQRTYAKVENDLYKIIKTQAESLKVYKFKSENMNVIYKKPKMLITDKEKLENIDKMLQLGLIEEHEKLIMVDPNLSDEQAKEKLARINKAKQSMVSQIMMASNKNVEPDEDEDTEENGDNT